jgi:hypothetical protein
MGDKQEKCKAPGCRKVTSGNIDSEYCSDHQCKLDPISALYVDKTPEQMQADENICRFFSYLLHNRTPQDLLS